MTITAVDPSTAVSRMGSSTYGIKGRDVFLDELIDKIVGGTEGRLETVARSFPEKKQ